MTGRSKSDMTYAAVAEIFAAARRGWRADPKVLELIADELRAMAPDEASPWPADAGLQLRKLAKAAAALDEALAWASTLPPSADGGILSSLATQIAPSVYALARGAADHEAIFSSARMDHMWQLVALRFRNHALRAWLKGGVDYWRGSVVNIAAHANGRQRNGTPLVRVVHDLLQLTGYHRSIDQVVKCLTKFPPVFLEPKQEKTDRVQTAPTKHGPGRPRKIKNSQ